MEEMSLECKLNRITGKIIIYGAHLVALECCRFLISNGKRNHIVGFAVTDTRDNPTDLEGFQVKEIGEYAGQYQACTVIMAMPEKYHKSVESHARSKGFRSFVKVSLEEMSVLKGRELIGEWQKDAGYSFGLEESSHDPTWLNVRETGGTTGRYYKFPTLFYRDTGDVLRETEKCDLWEQYQRSLGQYRNLHEMVKDSRVSAAGPAADMMKIYMALSKRDSAKIVLDTCHAWICPLHLGERNAEEQTSCLYDDVGESIADKNRLLAEMTGAYWIWKNVTGPAYKGLCHYRRHFVISEKEILAMEQNGIDAVLTTARYAPYGVGNMFLAETPVKKAVFASLFQAIHRCTPEDEESFRDYMRSCFYYPNNMVVARNDIYDAYCQWIFPILFQMLDIDLETGYGHTGDRHIAYAAELLTSYFFVKHKDKYCIAVTDYDFYM